MAKAERPIEYEQLTAPLEFEERAAMFMDKIIEESKRHTLSVDVENKTLTDLEANKMACRVSLQKNKPAMYQKAFERGVERDRKSLVETVVTISIYGSSRALINKFEKEAHLIAKEFSGSVLEMNGINNFDENDEDYRLFDYISYVFKG